MTMFCAPLSAGLSYPTPVGLPLAPIHVPSGCEYLSLLSERIVSHLTGPLTSSPAAFLGAFKVFKKGPVPENSLHSRQPGIAHTPWLGAPPKIAWLTVLSPPPFWM